MTDLQKKLREAVAFDEAEAHRRFEKAWGHTQSPMKHAFFCKGIKSESDRLFSILSALEGCVEALEQVAKMKPHNNGIERSTGRMSVEMRHTLESKAASGALETLRTALERLEAK